MATQRRFRQALRVALLSLGTATPATWAMVKTTKQPFEHQIKGGATVLLHKGRGGGLSDMFGGGVSSGLGGSSVAEKNLDRITVGAGLIWGACIIALGLLLKANS